MQASTDPYSHTPALWSTAASNTGQVMKAITRFGIRPRGSLMAQL
ncbi:hypothetical protein OH492_08065 [Vibrio chagasii]|nr:hypothetical protein [Vibrio chagasii]